MCPTAPDKMGDALTAVLLSKLLFGDSGGGRATRRRSTKKRASKRSGRKVKWPWTKKKSCPKGYITVAKKGRARRCAKGSRASKQEMFDAIARHSNMNPGYGVDPVDGFEGPWGPGMLVPEPAAEDRADVKRLRRSTNAFEGEPMSEEEWVV